MAYHLFRDFYRFAEKKSFDLLDKFRRRIYAIKQVPFHLHFPALSAFEVKLAVSSFERRRIPTARVDSREYSKDITKVWNIEMYLAY